MSLENGATDFALIIKNVPKSSITAIQSFIYYNRVHSTWGQRAIGLAVEFYNIDNDPNLESPLASTNEISSYEAVYRFDFPAIDTYPTGDFSNTNSITQIASETLALKEVVSDIAYSANIVGGLKVDTITTTGNVDISGTLDVTGNETVGGTLDVTGNETVGGTLDVTGNTTIGGALQANGGITCDTDKFVVEDATGNTSIGGTLNVETSLTTNQLIVNDDLYLTRL